MTQEYDAIHEDIQEIKASLRRLETILQGNGTQGVITRLSLAECALQRLQESWINVNRFLVGVLSVLVIGVGTFLWSVLTHTIVIAGKVP